MTFKIPKIKSSKQWIYVGISVAALIAIAIFLRRAAAAVREGFNISYPPEIANFNEAVETENIKKLKLGDVSQYRQYLQSIQPAIDNYVATTKPTYDAENNKLNYDKNSYVNLYNRDKKYRSKQDYYYKTINKTHQQYVEQEYDSKLRDNNNKYNQLLQKQNDIRGAIERLTQKLDEREQYMNQNLINPDAPLGWCEGQLCQAPYDVAQF